MGPTARVGNGKWRVKEKGCIMSRKALTEKSLVQVGGHLSSASGLRHVVLNARALGYNVVQTMVGGSRDYKPHNITDDDAREFKKTTFGIQLFVHLPYVINPCESEPRRRNFYKHSVKQYIQVATRLGARGVVLHPGFKKELTTQEAYVNLLKFMEETVADDEALDMLLETDSGSKNGSAVGSTRFIADAVKDLDHPRIAMCMDTTHMYARGVDLWKKNLLEEFIDEFHRITRLVHLNVPDHNVRLGGHLDRHNTPFEERPEWDHNNLIVELTKRYPCVLERRSLAVQEKDIRFIRAVVGQKKPAQ